MSPYLAPIKYNHLDNSAFDYSRAIELEVLWRNDPNAIRVEVVSTNEPMLVDYQDNYAEYYGENPKIQLWQIDEFGNIIERSEKPYFQLVDGLIDSIIFGTLDEVINGYIIISR